LARLAARAASTGQEEIIMSSQEKEACGRQVMEQANRLLAMAGKAGGLVLSEETRAFAGGLLLKSGDVEVNCALDTILRLVREELALEVAAALFA
jgi:V/A-type H+-transporting ATPase subunit E